MTTYEQGFRDGQAALFDQLFALSMKCDSCPDFAYRIGRMYAEFGIANPKVQTQAINPKITRAIKLEDE